jgi:hypothetical protein
MEYEKTNDKNGIKNKRYDDDEIFEDEEVIKQRREWHRLIQGDRQDDIIQQELIAASTQAAKIRRTSLDVVQNIWTPIGPNNINGRIKSLAIHPTNGDIVYAGGANGGVWKTTNGGNSWFSTMDSELSMAIGAIGISANNPDVIYAATGESVGGSSPSFDGVGVYKTTDGGGDWDLLTSITSIRCSRVLVHHSDPNIVYVAGDRGFHKSVNGGATWTNLVIGGISNGNISDAVMDPILSNQIYVGIRNVGVFKTLDDGNTWTLLSNGLPTGIEADWIRLAIGPPLFVTSSPLVAKMGPDTGLLFKSIDAGASWTAVSWDYVPVPFMKTWTSIVAIDPADQDVIFGGGVDLWRSSDGGASFIRDIMTHSDHHVIAFSPTDTNVCYMATDGGVYKSTNKGQTWSLSSNGLVCTQLYVSDVAQTVPFVMGGGTQDQGFIKSNGSSEWVDTNAGNEGNVFVIDPNDSRNIYVDPWSGLLRKSTDGGETWNDIVNGIGQEIVRHLAVQPGESNTLLCAANPRHIFRSIDQGNNWEPVLELDIIDGEVTTYVVFSLSNPTDCYAATNKGRFYHSNSNGVFGTWVQPYLPADKPPTGYITCIAVAPDVIYISYGRNDNPPAPIYKSIDGGKHWSMANGVLTADPLPNVTVYSLVIDKQNSEVVYATTEIGIFRTRNGGDSWSAFDDGMPRVRSTGLTLHRSTNTLYASTMGRGVYRRMLSSPALATFTNLTGVAAFYNENDQRHHVFIVTTSGTVHEIWWQSGQQGIEGQRVLIEFDANTITRIAGFISQNDQRSHLITGVFPSGKVNEIWWQSGQQAIEGQREFEFESVFVAGYYSEDDQRSHIIVCTADGKLHEIWWQSGQQGIEGQRVLTEFDPFTMVGVAGYWSQGDQRNHVIVGTTNDGKVHEIWWQSGQQGIEGQRVLTEFAPSTLAGLAGFFSQGDQRHHVMVGTTDGGKLHEIWWQSGQQGIEGQGVLKEFHAFGDSFGFSGNIVAGYYADNDPPQHVIVGTLEGSGTDNGKVHDLRQSLANP